jgi:DNA-binding NtrC family response regulator
VQSIASQKRPTRVLIVDPGRTLANQALAHAHCAAGATFAVEAVLSGSEALGRLGATFFDVLVVFRHALDDIGVGPEDGLARLARRAEKSKILVLAPKVSVSEAVAAMGSGAHDFIEIPADPALLFSQIEGLIERHRRPATASGSTPFETDFAGFVGFSPQMRAVYEQIKRVAPSSAPVFITGESGTGKEVCAEALHAGSPRARGPFIAINCGAIPRDLMEAELFGVARGAFTGATHDRAGAVELADGGTLLLDEIGEMEPGLQAKLLRFVQTGEVNRVGAPLPRKVDVRIICATNRDPRQMIAERRFREDLFYRLHVLPIHLPTLRQRPGDILALSEMFVARFAAEEGKSFAGVSEGAALLLKTRPWRGNVRELQNLVRRIVVMFDGGPVDAEMVRLADTAHLSQPFDPTPAPLHARDAKSDPIAPMWQQEQAIIERALAAFGGNISRAAAALEISPSTIYRKKQTAYRRKQTEGPHGTDRAGEIKVDAA